MLCQIGNKKNRPFLSDIRCLCSLMNGINMDLSKILTAKDGRELLEYSKDAYDLVQAEKNRPIPLVITLTGNEIDEVELDETLQIDPKKIYEKRVSTFFKKNRPNNTLNFLRKFKI